MNIMPGWAGVAGFTKAAAGDTVLLLHGEAFTDSSGKGHALTTSSVDISTAQFKFGTASYLFNVATDWIRLDGSTDFAFGTGDFTVDCWVRWSSATGNTFIFDFRGAGVSTPISCFLNGSIRPAVNAGGSLAITGTSIIIANTWYHIAVTRSAGSTRLFVNGTQEGSTFADLTDYPVGANAPRIGNGSLEGSGIPGWIDEFRVLKGTAAWSANFTPPTAPY